FFPAGAGRAHRLGARARQHRPRGARASRPPSVARAGARMILAEDLAAIDRQLAPYWHQLAGARILMTGGTGFIGRWMLEALARSGVDAEVLILSRDPAGFA